MLRRFTRALTVAVTALAATATVGVVAPATASADSTEGLVCRQFVNGVGKPVVRTGAITPRSSEGGLSAEAGALIGGIFSGANFVKALIDEAKKSAETRADQAGFVESLEKRLAYLTKGEYNISIFRAGRGFKEDVLQKANCFGTVHYQGKDASASYDVYVFDSDGKVWSEEGNYGYHNWRHYGSDHYTGTPGSRSDQYTYWFPTRPQKSAHEAADARNAGGSIKPAHGRVTSLISDNGFAADLDNSKTSSGTKIQSWSPNGTQAQKWALWDKGNGRWLIETDFRGGMVMDVVPNGWNLHLIKEHGGTNQLWRFEDYGNGWYKIRSVYNMENGYPDGGCLTADGQGGALHAWVCDRGFGSGQLWRLPG